MKLKKSWDAVKVGEIYPQHYPAGTELEGELLERAKGLGLVESSKEASARKKAEADAAAEAQRLQAEAEADRLKKAAEEEAAEQARAAEEAAAKAAAADGQP